MAVGVPGPTVGVGVAGVGVGVGTVPPGTAITEYIRYVFDGLLLTGPKDTLPAGNTFAKSVWVNGGVASVFVNVKPVLTHEASIQVGIDSRLSIAT